jgi:Tol biopolymer transport system component
VRRIKEDRAVRIGRLLAGTVAALVLGAAPAAAAFPGANGRIAYDGDQSLGTINAVGGDRKPLISQAGVEFAAPAWSPDGQRLAFSTNRDTGASFEVYVAPASGASMTRLTNNAADDDAPTWSPDGSKIAFESDRDVSGRRQIYVMNADGSGVMRLTSTVTDDHSPAWSPDGSRIAFTREAGAGGDIVVMSASGGTATPLANTASDETNPDWSPNGASIVYQRDTGIATMGADGSAQTPLVGAGAAARPAWAPDGTRIVFDRASELWATNPDGSGTVQLTTAGATELVASNPNWQPIVAPPPPPPPSDADHDGVAAPLDCNDANPSIRPGAPDKPGDKIDQDCNGRDARYRLLGRSIEAFTATYPLGRYTTFTTLTVKPVRRGDRLRLTCKGPGCELRKKTIRVRKNARKLSVLRHLKGSKLRKGAVVQLRVTRPGTVGRVATWKIRAPKIPNTARSCLQPGAKKTSRCPRS